MNIIVWKGESICVCVYVCCFGSVEVVEEAKNITPFVNVLMSS